MRMGSAQVCINSITSGTYTFQSDCMFECNTVDYSNVFIIAKVQ